MDTLLTIEYYVIGIYICSVTGLILTVLTFMDKSTANWRTLVDTLVKDAKAFGEDRGATKYE